MSNEWRWHDPTSEEWVSGTWEALKAAFVVYGGLIVDGYPDDFTSEEAYAQLSTLAETQMLIKDEKPDG